MPRRLLAGAGLLVLLILGTFVYQAWQAASALSTARGRAADVADLVATGEFAQAAGELQQLQEATGRAAGATDGVLWGLGAHLPFIGDEIDAVQKVAAALDEVTRRNAPVALRLARAVDAGKLRPHAGRIDLDVVRRLTPAVREAADSISAQQRRLETIDARSLGFPFDQVVRELSGQVRRAAVASRATATAFELLPEMLGAKGPRSYLLLVQNNAEVRSTGGIPGSVAVLHADQGRVQMGFQGSAGDVTAPVGRVAGVSPSALAVYGSTMVTDLRDVTFDPDFPDVARTAAAMLEQRRGLRVDGVLSVDPVALAFLLGGTGPVRVDLVGRQVTLDQATVVPSLLNLVYQVVPDAEQQNDFFAATARSIFDTVMAGGGRSSRAIAGLAHGVAEHRVLLWSRHPAEQQQIAGTAVAGELPVDASDPQPHVGIYLNDATAGKPEFYLDYQPTLHADSCRDGVQRLTASVAFTSSMPRDHARLSDFITGNGRFAPEGTIAFNVRIYAPVDGAVTAITVDGRAAAVTADRHDGRQVAVLPMALRPGQRVVVRASLRGAPGQVAGPVLSFTPGVRSQPNGVQTTSACSS